MCKPSESDEDRSAEDTYLVCAAISIRNHCLRNPEVVDVSQLPKLVAEAHSSAGAKALREVGVTIPLRTQLVKVKGQLTHMFFASCHIEEMTLLIIGH
jgi:hypothetical protein